MLNIKEKKKFVAFPQWPFHAFVKDVSVLRKLFVNKILKKIATFHDITSTSDRLFEPFVMFLIAYRFFIKICWPKITFDSFEKGKDIMNIYIHIYKKLKLHKWPSGVGREPCKISYALSMPGDWLCRILSATNAFRSQASGVDI